MIIKIEDENELIAMIIPVEHKSAGIEFFTPEEFTQQLAYMNRPSGYVIEPHLHNRVKREVYYTKEALFIRSGKVRVDFYNENKVYLKSNILNAGDVILLAKGAHGFEMLEESDIIEIKQGPYVGEQDKTRFESIETNQIKFDK